LVIHLDLSKKLRARTNYIKKFYNSCEAAFSARVIIVKRREEKIGV